MSRMRRSTTLEGVQRRVMGRWEEGCVGSLLGLRIVMMVPCFQMSGIMLCAKLWFAMLVSAVYAMWAKVFEVNVTDVVWPACS